jgi:hypothetical protein
MPVSSESPLNSRGILTPLQQEFLEVFAGLPDKSQFYLTGGTALAEYFLGHRLSFDLDFFTSAEGLILPTSYQIEAACQKQKLSLRVVRRFSTLVEFLLEKGNDSLKIDVALDSPFRFAPPVPTPAGVLVNDYQDLRVDKLLAYYGRAEPRDAVDVFFILQTEPVEPLLEQAAQKDPGFDLYWFAIALNRCQSFPDELERWPVKMLKPFEPAALKKSFQALALEIMDRTTQH